MGNTASIQPGSLSNNFSPFMLSATGRAYTMLRQNEWCYSDMGAIIYSPDRLSKTNGWSDIYDKTGFPLNNFCINHEVKGFF